MVDYSSSRDDSRDFTCVNTYSRPIRLDFCFWQIRHPIAMEAGSVLNSFPGVMRFTLQLTASGGAKQRYSNQVRTTCNEFAESAIKVS